MGNHATRRCLVVARKNKGPVTRLDAMSYSLNIDANDRTTLNGLLDQLRDILMHDSSSDIARRLFPAAYHQDEQHEQEYQRLMRDELLSSRLASLSLTTSLLERETNSDSIVLSADELDALMRSINSLRLVLGTLLDVHNKGRAVVSSGTREHAEFDVYRLHEHGLWATMQREDA